MNRFNATTTPRFNTSVDSETLKLQQDSAYKNSAFGLAVETFKGIPKATGEVVTDIFHSVMRSAASIFPTIGAAANAKLGTNLPEQTNVPDAAQHPIAAPVFKFLYGDQPIKNLAQQIAENEVAIKDSPFAQKYGLDQHALPLAFGATIGGTFLDLYPGGAAEKNAIKALVKESDEVLVKSILNKMKVPEEVAGRFSGELAAAKSEKEVADILNNVRATVGLGQIEQKMAKASPEELASLEKALNPEIEVAQRQAFDEFDRLTGTAADNTINTPVIRESIPASILDAAKKDWSESASKQYDALHAKGLKIADELKTTKSASKRGLLRSQLDSVVAQQDELEGEFVRKWRVEAGLPEHIPETRGMDMGPSFEANASAAVKRRAPHMQRFEEILNETKEKGWKLDRFLQAADELYPKDDPGTRADLTTIFNQLFNRTGVKANSRDISKAAQGIEMSRARMRSIGSIINSKVETPASLLLQLPQNELRAVRNLIDDKVRTVKDKVHFFDYLATPEFVLEKIGLARESKLLQKAKDGYLKELPVEMDKIGAWRDRVGKGDDVSRRIFQWLDGNPNGKIIDGEELKVATEIKNYLGQWADRLDLPKWKRVSNYITHIFEPDLLKKEFDDDLARLITDKTPGSVYDPFLEKRLGQMGYVEDTWRALDAYTKRAVRKANFDPALAKLSKAAEHLDLNSEKYVMRLAGRVNLRPTEVDNLLDNFLKSLPVVGYKFGQRPVANFTQSLRRVFYRGTLGLNIGSALRNLTQGANTYAKLGERYTVQGYFKVFTRLLTKNLDELTEVGVLQDNFIQDRKVGVYKSMLEKMDKGLFVFFDLAEKINRGAAYFGAKSKAINKGLSEREAVDYAKRMVRETQFAFSNVDSPVAMSSDIVKTLGQLQTFNIKQVEFLTRMAKNKEFAGLTRWTLGSLAMVFTLGRLFGMKPEQLIPSIGLGNSPFASGASAAWGSVNPGATAQEQEASRKDLQRALVSLIPAGSQLRKSIQGYEAASEGEDTTATGRKRFDITSTSDKIRATIFGKSSLPQAQEYYESLDNKGSTKTGNRFNQ